MSLARRLLLAVGLAALAAAPAGAWPAEAMTALTRDARRLLPRSLSQLLGAREAQVQQQMARLPPAVSQGVARDLRAGRLTTETVAAVDAELAGAVQLLRERRVSEGLVRLGGLARVTADLSDPVLAVGAEGWPRGLPGEYYALFAANVGRMPVVLDYSLLCRTAAASPPVPGCSASMPPGLDAFELKRAQLPAIWQSLVERSRQQVPTIREELVHEGRVVGHERLDFRSPAWAAASVAYSRAVTATAVTWLAAWREAHGDLTRMATPRVVAPVDAPAPAAAPDRRLSPPEAP
ncbi:MAG TPA: hypothetical protein VMX54_03055 [Vicinamibacteria bacterium]|nr:hypothetical protein [Vicinamibacteria bacterium]